MTKIRTELKMYATTVEATIAVTALCFWSTGDVSVVIILFIPWL
jgi:hypothetical protein